MTTDNIPRSRLTLTYVTKVDGKPKDVELPFRMVVLGDLSGKPEEQRGDLDQRVIRRLDGKNLSKVMNDMNLTSEFDVPNRIGHGGSDTLKVKLKFDNINAFSPEAVSEQIEPVKALKLLKSLLTEVQSNLDNSKAFRGLIRQLPGKPQELKDALREFTHFDVARLGTPKAKDGATPALDGALDAAKATAAAKTAEAAKLKAEAETAAEAAKAAAGTPEEAAKTAEATTLAKQAEEADKAAKAAASAVTAAEAAAAKAKADGAAKQGKGPEVPKKAGE